MITSLSIKNFALIDDVTVRFEPGFSAITGETGAGKSIILGALGLVLGKRADLSSVRNDEKKCVIEAVFSIGKYDLKHIFEVNDLDYEPQTIVRREILPGGKSRAFVNDTPVTLNQLQGLAPHLVDVHSQHETLELASEDFQMEVLDALAKNTEMLSSYKIQLSEYKKVSASLSELKEKKEEMMKELDYQTFLFKELKEAGLESLDQQELEETFETLNNAEEIQEALGSVFKFLSEEQIGTIETAKESRNTLAKLKNFSSQFESLWERLNSTIIELDDISETVEQLSETTEADPQKLQEVNDRLQMLYKLQQKHSVATVSELLTLQNDLEDKIDVTSNLDERILSLEKEVSEKKAKTLKTANVISENRKKAVPVVKEKLEAFLKELGLPNAQFTFQIKQSESLKNNGVDTLELLFTANKGMTRGPLRKVASGGEMSRIMLSIKALLAHYKNLPTLVFDEIDTGISGQIALKMADMLTEMSANMQLICITHLPQIAAKAAHQFRVFKEDVNEVTQTKLEALNKEERLIEIAQMIGGKTYTNTTLANARELLN